jgi:hypothetical protein
VVLTFHFTPYLWHSTSEPRPEWPICLLCSLVYKALVRGEVYALVAIVCLVYAHIVFQHESTALAAQHDLACATESAASLGRSSPIEVSPEQSPGSAAARGYWETVLDALPVAVAIQAQKSQAWTYCNAALCRLLNVEGKTAAYERMGELQAKLGEGGRGEKLKRRQSAKIGGGTFGEIGDVFSAPSDPIAPAEGNPESGGVTLCFEDWGNKKMLHVCCQTFIWEQESMTIYSLSEIRDPAQPIARPADGPSAQVPVQVQVQAQAQAQVQVQGKLKPWLLCSVSCELRALVHCFLQALERCKKHLAPDSGTLTTINIALSCCHLVLNKCNDLLVTLSRVA